MTKPAIEMHTDGTPNTREWQSGCDVTFISEPIKIVLPKMKRAIVYTTPELYLKKIQRERRQCGLCARHKPSTRNGERK